MRICLLARCVVSGCILLSCAAVTLAADGDAKSPAGQSSDAARRQFDGAVALHKGGAFDLAVDEWEKFLKKFPDDPLAAQAQFFAGVCYLSLKDKQYDKAREAFERVVAKYPKFEQLDKAYFDLGLADYNLAQAGRGDLYAKASDAFGQLIDKFPRSAQAPEALLYRGESLYALGKKDEAVKAWSELTAKFADSPARARGLYNLGIAEQELGKQAEASATFDAFIKNYPQHELAAEVRMRKGDTLLETGRFADAERHFSAALKQREFPLADYATLRLGAALAGEKRYAEAAAAYASLPGKFPKSSFVGAATLAAGNCYYLSGNQTEARAWLGKVLAGGGEQAAEAAHWIARSWLKEKHPAEALAAVERALPLAEKSQRAGDLLMDKADALYDMPDRRAEAAAVYAKLAEKSPNNPQAAQALSMAASAALGTGDYPAALKYVDSFHRTFPKNQLLPEVDFVAAEAQLLSGNHAEADRRYKELLDTYPNHADAEQWLVRRALSRYMQKQYGDVVSSLRPQLSRLKSPERQAEAHFLLGSSELELKHYREAIEALKASLAAQPKGPQADEALLALATAQRGANDAAGAKATIDRLLTDFGDSKLADRAHFRSGEWKFESGDYAGAAADYQWIVDHAASSTLAPGALVKLGWSHFNRTDYAAAEKTFSRAIDKFGGQPAAVRALYGRAAARQQLKQFVGAIADADAFLKADPNSSERSDALYVLGLAQEGSQKFTDSAKTFQNLLDGDPKYSGGDKALYELAWSRKSAGDEDGAADAFGKLAREHSDSPLAAESWFNVGERAYAKKDFKVASDAYYAAATKAPKGELADKAGHKLGWAYFQAQDYRRAQQAFESELSSYPAGALAPDTQFMIGESLFKQEKYEPALAALRRALDMKLTSAEFSSLALLHASEAAAQLARWEDSVKLLARLKKEHSDSAHIDQATYDEGWAKQNLNQLDDALALYEAVADKTDAVVGARARFMMGEVYFAKKNYDEAIRNYFKVIYGYGDTQAPAAYKTWQADATYEAARCCEVKQSPEQAKKLYRELVVKYPDSNKVAAAKERLKQLGDSVGSRQ
jgi:TolA-binding protein